MQVLTVPTGHHFERGNFVSIDKPRPPWWRLIALVKWWREPVDMLVITEVIGTTLTVRPPKHEMCMVPYDKADAMLRADEGWRLADAEDTNRTIGWVYLERTV